MQKTLMLAAAFTFIAGGALADDSIQTNTHSSYTPDNNGGYESTTTHQVTTPEGQVTGNTNKKVEMNDSGMKETTVKSHSASDPAGLSNRSTTQINDRSINSDGSQTTKTKIINENDTTEQH